MVFSFRHLYFTDKFTPAERDGQYTIKLLERLKSICHLTPEMLHASRSPSLRCHPIDFDGTSEPEGFAQLPEPVKREQHAPYQITISEHEHGRIHGFFIDEIYYVVWIDPDHELYPRNN